MIASDDGQGLVEYAMIVALIAVVAIVALRILGSHASDTFSCMAQAFSHVANC